MKIQEIAQAAQRRIETAAKSKIVNKLIKGAESKGMQSALENKKNKKAINAFLKYAPKLQGDITPELAAEAIEKLIAIFPELRLGTHPKLEHGTDAKGGILINAQLGNFSQNIAALMRELRDISANGGDKSVKWTFKRPAGKAGVELDRLANAKPKDGKVIIANNGGAAVFEKVKTLLADLGIKTTVSGLGNRVTLSMTEAAHKKLRNLIK